MAVSEPGSKQELMRRFLESAHDLSDPNHSHGSLSMHRVCTEIGLTPNDPYQMIMSAHFRTGNLAADTGDRAPEPDYFRITPKEIDGAALAQSSAEPYR
jgi:hypothetical protein